MSYRVYPATLTSNMSLGASVDLTDDPIRKIMVVIPSMASGSMQFLASESSTGTFYKVLAVDGSLFSVNSSVVANGCVAVLPGTYKFIKAYNTSGATDVVKTLQFICSY